MLARCFDGSRFFSSLKRERKEGEIEELKDKRDIDRTRFYRDLDRSPALILITRFELDAANYLDTLMQDISPNTKDLPLAVLSQLLLIRSYCRSPISKTMGRHLIDRAEAFRDSGRALRLALDHAIQNSE